MAEKIYQPIEVRKAFGRLIADAERQRRKAAADRMKATVPVLGALLAPIATLAMFDEDLRNGNRGDDGEGAVSRILRSLPKSWCFLNNVVVEHREGEFMQIDHIAVGPSTIAVIETKKWRGAVLGNGDSWKVKSQGKWHPTSSPSRQATWHANAIRRHLASAGFQRDVVPLVVFVDPEWLRVNGCPCAVFDGPRALRRHLLSLDGNSSEAVEGSRQIAEFLATVPTLQGRAPDQPAAAGPPTLPNPVRLPPEKPPSSVPASEAAATPKQRGYVTQLLRGAGLQPAEDRLECLTRTEAQAVIDRLRFHRDVPLPEGLVVAVDS